MGSWTWAWAGGGDRRRLPWIEPDIPKKCSIDTEQSITGKVQLKRSQPAAEPMDYSAAHRNSHRHS
jgi:hypothetical protein